MLHNVHNGLVVSKAISGRFCLIAGYPIFVLGEYIGSQESVLSGQRSKPDGNSPITSSGCHRITKKFRYTLSYMKASGCKNVRTALCPLNFILDIAVKRQRKCREPTVVVLRVFNAL